MKTKQILTGKWRVMKNKRKKIINEKLNLTNTTIELENKVKCIYIDKYKYGKIDFK